MIQIKDTLVSLDLVERYFECDLESCLGECCVAGDAGAPLTEEENEWLKELMPVVLPHLSEAARRVVEEQGPSYIDEEGDLVTSLVEGGNCVFTTYEKGGLCLCALEKLRRAGDERIFKPISCSLYPVRLKKYPTFTAVNFHRWKICKCAEVLGRKNNVRAYEFLEGPLTRRFGPEWYAELKLTAEEWLKQNPEEH